LAVLSTSLYISLAFLFRTPKQFTPLIEAFLTGYYGKASARIVDIVLSRLES